MARLSLWLLAALVVLAPLFRAGKAPLGLMTLELLALAGLLVFFVHRAGRANLPLAEKLLLGALVVFPLLQLVPLPGVSRAQLPGQADMYLALQAAGVEEGWATLSALPRETLAGWLILLVPVAVYLLTRSLPVNSLRGVLVILFWMAGFQACLGLVQFGTFPDLTWYLGMERTHHGSAVGTYTSRNNFVGFMYLSLMASLALFMATLGKHRQAGGKRSLRQKLEYFATPEGHRAFVYGALALLLLLAIVFSRSRAGIGLTMLGVVLASAAFSSRIGGGNVYGLTGRIVSLVAALGIAIGLGPVWERFSAQDPLTDGRWIIFDGVFQGIGQFFPFGSGTGTFVHTFPAFQDLSQAAFTINRAHNSYLEWIYNGGVVAIGMIIAFLAVYALRWRKVWKKGEWGEFRYIQVGAGLGMLLMLLHDLVDYNLFVPANMAYFAFFAGLFFYPYQEPVRIKQRRSKPDHTSEARSRQSLLHAVDEDTGKNPFMDS